MGSGICHAAIRHLFKSKGKDFEFMDDSSTIKRAKSAVRRSVETERSAKRQKSQAPFTYEMVTYLRNILWENSADLKNNVAYLAVACMYCFALRISNISTKYALMVDDCIFETDDNKHYHSFELLTSGYLAERFVRIIIWARDSKTGPYEGEKLTIMKRSSEEATFLSDMVSFALKANHVASDKFFSFHYLVTRCNGVQKPYHWCVTASDVSSVTKLAAVHFNLPHDWYATHCMRIGAATDARQVISAEEVKKIFHWRSDAALGYMRNFSEVASNSLALLGKGENLDVTDVRRIMVFNQKTTTTRRTWRRWGERLC